MPSPDFIVNSVELFAFAPFLPWDSFHPSTERQYSINDCCLEAPLFLFLHHIRPKLIHSTDQRSRRALLTMGVFRSSPTPSDLLIHKPIIVTAPFEKLNYAAQSLIDLHESTETLLLQPHISYSSPIDFHESTETLLCNLTSATKSSAPLLANSSNLESVAGMLPPLGLEAHES